MFKTVSDSVYLFLMLVYLFSSVNVVLKEWFIKFLLEMREIPAAV